MKKQVQELFIVVEDGDEPSGVSGDVSQTIEQARILRDDLEATYPNGTWTIVRYERKGVVT